LEKETVIIFQRLFDFDFGDFGHEAGGFIEGDDDFLVVEDVVEIELEVFTIFEPFLGGLVSADVEAPDKWFLTIYFIERK